MVGGIGPDAADEVDRPPSKCCTATTMIAADSTARGRWLTSGNASMTTANSTAAFTRTDSAVLAPNARLASDAPMLRPPVIPPAAAEKTLPMPRRISMRLPSAFGCVWHATSFGAQQRVESGYHGDRQCAADDRRRKRQEIRGARAAGRQVRVQCRVRHAQSDLGSEQGAESDARPARSTGRAGGQPDQQRRHFGQQACAPSTSRRTSPQRRRGSAA